MIKIRQIEFFLSVLKAKSIQKAALELNVSQPGVSKAILDLEESMSVKLIERLPKGIVPTEFGKILEKYSYLILNDISNVNKEIKLLKDGIVGNLRVGVAFSPRIYLVPMSTVNLYNKYPNIHLKIHAGHRRDLLSLLFEGKIDLFVSAIIENDPTFSEEANRKHLEFIPLYKDSQFLVTRNLHPLQSKKNIQLKDTLNYEWILPDFEETFKFTNNLQYEFKKNNLDFPNPKIVYNSANFALNIIKNSNFIGIHPKQMIETQGEGLVKSLRIDDLFMEPSYGITYLKNKPLGKSSEYFIEELVNVSSDMIKNGLVKSIN